MSSYSMLHGDALATLREMPSASASIMVTDPPFTAAGGSTNGRSAGHEADTQFFMHWLTAVMAEATRVVAPTGCAFICCDWRTQSTVERSIRAAGVTQTSKRWEVTQMMVWDRGSIGLGSPFRNQFELIAFARGPDFDRGDRPRNRSNVLNVRWPYGSHPNHPAEKPPELFRPLIEMGCWGVDNPLVLDPFAGSASAGVASAMEGVRYLGIEIDDEAYAVAGSRLSAAYGCQGSAAPVVPQMGLFGVAP